VGGLEGDNCVREGREKGEELLSIDVVHEANDWISQWETVMEMFGTVVYVVGSFLAVWVS
jgi:hypothetical protein